jgi:hypothetical protein
MTGRLLVLSIAVLALLLVPAASNPADAHRGGHSHGGGYGSFRSFGGGGSYGHRHHHHRFIYLGAPYYYGDYYSYGDGCYWLRRRALYTGSRYWWTRYYACIGY